MTPITPSKRFIRRPRRRRSAAVDDRGWNLFARMSAAAGRCQSCQDIGNIPVRGDIERASPRVAIGERSRVMRRHLDRNRRGGRMRKENSLVVPAMPVTVGGRLESSLLRRDLVFREPSTLRHSSSTRAVGHAWCFGPYDRNKGSGAGETSHTSARSTSTRSQSRRHSSWPSETVAFPKLASKSPLTSEPHLSSIATWVYFW